MMFVTTAFIKRIVNIKIEKNNNTMLIVIKQSRFKQEMQDFNRNCIVHFDLREIN